MFIRATGMARALGRGLWAAERRGVAPHDGASGHLSHIMGAEGMEVWAGDGRVVYRLYSLYIRKRIHV